MDSEDDELLLARKEYESLRRSVVKVRKSFERIRLFRENLIVRYGGVLFKCAGSGRFQRGGSSRTREVSPDSF